MDLLSKLQNIIPLDKQLHFYAGLAIGFTLSVFIPFLIAFVIVMIIGALKELYDYLHPDKHSCEFLDWLATTLGGLYVVIICLISSLF